MLQEIRLELFADAAALLEPSRRSRRGWDDARRLSRTSPGSGSASRLLPYCPRTREITRGGLSRIRSSSARDAEGLGVGAGLLGEECARTLFGLTKDLSDTFSDRVRNAPISEAAVMG